MYFGTTMGIPVRGTKYLPIGMYAGSNAYAPKPYGRPWPTLGLEIGPRWPFTPFNQGKSRGTSKDPDPLVVHEPVS